MCANMWKEHQMIQELLSPHMRENITMKPVKNTNPVASETDSLPPKSKDKRWWIGTMDWKLHQSIFWSVRWSSEFKGNRSQTAKAICNGRSFFLWISWVLDEDSFFFFFFLVFSFLWVSKSISRWDKLTLNLSYHFTLFFWSSPFCG